MKHLRETFHGLERVILWFVIAAPLAVHYFGWVFPEGAEHKLLPLAVACIFLVVVEMLLSIDKKLDDRFIRKQYASMTDAIPDMLAIVKVSRRKEHVIKVLASSGGTTVNALLPALQQEVEDHGLKIEMHINLADPTSPIAQYMPSHWAREVSLSLERLRAASARGVRVTCAQYQYLPCLGGALVDNDHLFLGLYVWEGKTQLGGAEQPHFYFRRGAEADHLFDVWQSWFDLGPNTPIPMA